MNKKRPHRTTKNTVPKRPVTKLNEYTMDINGAFSLVTDISPTHFDKLHLEWFHHPATTRWCGESLAAYINLKCPKNICLLKEDYEAKIAGKGVIPATKEEYEAENN